MNYLDSHDKFTFRRRLKQKCIWHNNICIQCIHWIRHTVFQVISAGQYNSPMRRLWTFVSDTHWCHVNSLITVWDDCACWTWPFIPSNGYMYNNLFNSHLSISHSCSDVTQSCSDDIIVAVTSSQTCGNYIIPPGELQLPQHCYDFNTTIPAI